MTAGTSTIVKVLDPRNGNLVPRIANLYILMLPTDGDDPLLLCRAENPAGDVVPESRARKIYTDAIAKGKGAIPYSCNPDVCGYCLENRK